MLDKIPQDPEVFGKESTRPELVKSAVSVQDRIQSSEQRAGKTSMVEHKPGEKSKFDATAEDIGKAVAFLVSEDARAITGQSLNVNGGNTMN